MQFVTAGGGVRRAVLVVAVICSLLVAGCSGSPTTLESSAPTTAPGTTQSDGELPTRQGELGALSAKGLVDALNREGLPAPNPTDTTARECPAAGCLQSIVTDNLRVKSFASTGQAQIYAAERNLYQVTTVVVDFAPPMTESQQTRYEEAIQRLVD